VFANVAPLAPPHTIAKEPVLTPTWPLRADGAPIIAVAPQPAGVDAKFSSTWPLQLSSTLSQVASVGDSGDPGTHGGLFTTPPVHDVETVLEQ
jgi:hypothetical protein